MNVKASTFLDTLEKARDAKCLKPTCSFVEQDAAFEQFAKDFEDFKNNIEEGKINNQDVSNFPPCTMLKGKLGEPKDNIGVDRYCEMYYANLDSSVQYNIYVCVKYVRLRSFFYF